MLAVVVLVFLGLGSFAYAFRFKFYEWQKDQVVKNLPKPIDANEAKKLTNPLTSPQPQPEAGPPPAELGSMYYVYIIKSLIKDWKYTGSTEDIPKRLVLHNSGATQSTKPFRPFEVIHSEVFATKTEALRRERFLKKNFKAREEIYKKLGLI